MGKHEVIHQEKMTEKYFRNIIQQLLLMCSMLKKWIYILLKFQNTTQIMKKTLVIFVMTSSGERWDYLSVKTLSALLRGIT